MPKNENIFVHLQIEKDSQTKALALNVRFDKNAPNFSIDTDGIYWSPTLEEIDFIVEAFAMMCNGKPSHQKNQQSTKTEKPWPQQPVKNEETVRAPYESKIAISATTTSETTTEPHSEYHPKHEIYEDKIFVQADEHSIDEALKRRKTGDEDYVASPSDRTVLDKMLKQKKKKE